MQFKCVGCLFTLFTDLDVKMHAGEEESGGFSKNKEWAVRRSLNDLDLVHPEGAKQRGLHKIRSVVNFNKNSLS